MPALPQQWSEPGRSWSRRPGIARSTASGASLHPLRVLQVAGRVVGDVQRQSGRPASGPPRQGARSRRAPCAARPAADFVAEQMAVVLEQRAAARAVDHDVVGRVGQGGDVQAGEGDGGVAVAGVLVQRAAAGLAVDLDHSVAVVPRGFCRVASWTWRKSVSMTQPRNRATVGLSSRAEREIFSPCIDRRGEILAPLGMTAGRREHPHPEPELSPARQRPRESRSPGTRAPP